MDGLQWTLKLLVPNGRNKDKQAEQKTQNE